MDDIRQRPAYLEIDLASEQGVALLDSVTRRHGRQIGHVAALASRIFLLRSPWAPGLRFVGAETKPPEAEGQEIAQVTFSLSGSGDSLEDAFASCMGEGIDRLAQIERRDDVAIVASLPEVQDRVLPSIIPLIEQGLIDRAQSTTTPLAWVNGKQVGHGDGSTSAPDVLLPADWCLRRPADRIRLAPRTALSVGVAAGPDFDWAASRALLELVERDAASLWWTGGRRGRIVAPEQPGMAETMGLLARLRQQACHRRTWLLDITTDIQIPAVAALSCDKDGRRLAYGLAARVSVAQAARAAILELCQTELAVLLAEAKLMDAGEDGLTPLDRAHLQRGHMIDAARCELLYPLGFPFAHHVPDDQSSLSAVAGALANAGVEAALVELTRAEFGIPVVRAVAPALQPMPSDVITDRLQQTLTEVGGGRRPTGGIDLI